MRAELLEKGTGFQADDFSLQVFVCGYVAILLSLFLTFPYFDFVNNSKMSVLCLFTLSMLKFQIFLYYKQQRWVDQSIQTKTDYRP